MDSFGETVAIFSKLFLTHDLSRGLRVKNIESQTVLTVYNLFILNSLICIFSRKSIGESYERIKA